MVLTRFLNHQQYLGWVLLKRDFEIMKLHALRIIVPSIRGVSNLYFAGVYYIGPQHDATSEGSRFLGWVTIYFICKMKPWNFQYSSSWGPPNDILMMFFYERISDFSVDDFSCGPSCFYTYPYKGCYKDTGPCCCYDSSPLLRVCKHYVSMTSLVLWTDVAYTLRMWFP